MTGTTSIHIRHAYFCNYIYAESYRPDRGEEGGIWCIHEIHTKVCMNGILNTARRSLLFSRNSLSNTDRISPINKQTGGLLAEPLENRARLPAVRRGGGGEVYRATLARAAAGGRPCRKRKKRLRGVAGISRGGGFVWRFLGGGCEERSRCIQRAFFFLEAYENSIELHKRGPRPTDPDPGP